MSGQGAGSASRSEHRLGLSDCAGTVARGFPDGSPDAAELGGQLGVFQVAKLAHHVGRQIAARQLAGLDRGEQVPAGCLAAGQRAQDVAPLGCAQRPIGFDQDLGRWSDRRMPTDRGSPGRRAPGAAPDSASTPTS